MNSKTNDFITVNVSPKLINEFIEDLEDSFLKAEEYINRLEKDKSDILQLEAIIKIFKELSLDSIKFDIEPLTEIFNHAILVYEILIKWQFFSVTTAELLLLYLDRIVDITKKIERNSIIDSMDRQLILNSFQQIYVIKNHDECEIAIDNAFKFMTKSICMNTIQSEADECLELFLSEKVTPKSSNNNNISKDEQAANVKKTSIFIPKTLKDPLLYAREYVVNIMQDSSMQLLSNLSDINNSDGFYNNQFILEIGLAINYIAGEPINPEGLAQGICLRDIALVNNKVNIHKPDKLTQNELKLMQQHTIVGAKLAADFHMDETAVQAILEHHERIDGNGYPYKLKNDQISDAGKLTAIIDSFNAMIDRRPYKKFTHSTLRSIAEVNACINIQYDSFWISQFNLLMREYWLPIHANHKNHIKINFREKTSG